MNEDAAALAALRLASSALRPASEPAVSGLVPSPASRLSLALEFAPSADGPPSSLGSSDIAPSSRTSHAPVLLFVQVVAGVRPRTLYRAHVALAAPAKSAQPPFCILGENDHAKMPFVC